MEGDRKDIGHYSMQNCESSCISIFAIQWVIALTDRYGFVECQLN
jgi:hypothetical protein